VEALLDEAALLQFVADALADEYDEGIDVADSAHDEATPRAAP